MFIGGVQLYEYQREYNMWYYSGFYRLNTRRKSPVPHKKMFHVASNSKAQMLIVHIWHPD